VPFGIIKRRAAFTALAGTLLALTLSGAAHAAVSNPYDCSVQAVVSQSFAQWGDYAQYTPAPNAGVENGSAGWTLGAGAKVVDGNEPWKIGGSADAKALELAANSWAVTAPMCIDRTFPHFRFFANRLASRGDLKIDVLFYDTKGNIQATKAIAYHAALSGWLPTGMIDIGVFDAKTTVTAAPVAFRFTTTKDSGYRIDDVYVDPMVRH
jgi:hypothetical protein